MKPILLFILIIFSQSLFAQKTEAKNTHSIGDTLRERYQFKRSKERLLAIPKLMVWLPDCEFKVDFHVLSFECFIESKKENVWFYNQGENYSPELIQALQQVKPGDKIYFDRVVCKGNDNRIRNIGTTTVTIIP